MRTVRHLFRLLLTGALLLGLLGCATANKAADKAIQKYKAGDYEGALSDFKEMHEDRRDRPKTATGSLYSLNARWHLRYLVFRGLSHARAYEAHGNEADLQAARNFLVRGLKKYETEDRSFLSKQEEKEATATLARLSGVRSAEPSTESENDEPSTPETQPSAKAHPAAALGNAGESCRRAKDCKPQLACYDRVCQPRP